MDEGGVAGRNASSGARQRSSTTLRAMQKHPISGRTETKLSQRNVLNREDIGKAGPGMPAGTHGPVLFAGLLVLHPQRLVLLEEGDPCRVNCFPVRCPVALKEPVDGREDTLQDAGGLAEDDALGLAGRFP
jgi:hypothetical protein